MDDCIAFLRETDDFLILTHRNPDGDTLGGAAALCAGLRSIGKTAFLAVNRETTARYLPFVKDYYAPADWAFHTVVSVDVASKELLPEEYQNLKVDMKIDHHPMGKRFSERELVCPDRAASGEIVYQLLASMGVPLSREIASALYIAISTDTGCFRFANTTPATHRVAAALMETGINCAVLNEVFFSHKTLERFAVEARLTQEMEFFHGRSVAVGTLLLKTIEELGAGEDDLENLSALPRSVAGVEIGALIREEKGGCKISVRTSQKYKANEICFALGGGGHARAGGARVSTDIASAKAALLDAIEKARRG